MDTEGIIATVGTILLFAFLGFLSYLLKRKGIVATDYEPPRSHRDFMKGQQQQLAAPGPDTGVTPMGVRPPG